jgi:ABC-type nitrate/sulfonate/bicarbonate transport system permease component
MLGAAVLLGVLGYAASALVAVLERRLLRWEHPSAR